MSRAAKKQTVKTKPRKAATAAAKADEGLAAGPRPVRIIAALCAAGAFSKRSAVSGADLARATGLVSEEVYWLCRHFVGAGFAILETGDRYAPRGLDGRFFLTDIGEDIKHEAAMLRQQARSLASKADYLSRGADATAQALPYWRGVPQQDAGVDASEGKSGGADQDGAAAVA